MRRIFHGEEWGLILSKFSPKGFTVNSPIGVVQI